MPTKSTEIDLLHTLRKESGSSLPIDIWYDDEIWIFRPMGSVDSATSSDLEITLMEGINQGMQWIVLDMTDVRYISSAGLRVLILAAKKLKNHNGELILSGPGKDVLHIIEMTGLKKIFRVYPDNEMAVQSFQFRKEK